MLDACFVDDNIPEKFKGMEVISAADTIDRDSFSAELMISRIRELKKDTLRIHSFSNREIRGEISSSAEEILYLSFPWDKGWRLRVDGNEEELLKVCAGMSGVHLLPGKHSIELDYFLPVFRQGLIPSLGGILLLAGLLFVFGRKKGIGITGNDQP
jgi:uncharacterized membrane protein YfhO